MKRRSVLGGIIGAALAATPGGRLAALAGQQPADLQGCMSEPGLALYLGMFQGQFPMSSQELLPGANWQLFSSPYATSAFLFPPDWIGQVLFAASFTQNAATVDIATAIGLWDHLGTGDLKRFGAAWESVAGGIQGPRSRWSRSWPWPKRGDCWVTAIPAPGSVVTPRQPSMVVPPG